MVRSLWSAATGMNAQQTNVDTIANNLSNVNTVGYKEEVTSFKSLLYQNLQTRTTSANGEGCYDGKWRSEAYYFPGGAWCKKFFYQFQL